MKNFNLNYFYRKIPFTFIFIILIAALLNAQSVSVTTSSINLGTQTTADFVVSPAVAINYDVGNWQNYTLRAYTKNPDGEPGLVGQSDSSIKLPFKLWTPNYGPTTTLPDPSVVPNWAESWSWVPDSTEMISNNRFSWRRIAWYTLGDDGSTVNPVNVYFAFDLQKNGISHQAYSGTVYFELIDSYDNDNGAQSVVATFNMDITLNFSLNASIDLDESSLTQNISMQTTDTRIKVNGTLYANISASGMRSYNPAQDCNAVSVRTYTNNSPQDTSVVLNGALGVTNPSQTVALKLWTPNFGTGVDADNDNIPDVDNDTNWKSEQAVWVYAFDKNLPIRENAPWNYALFDYTDLIRLSNLHSDPDQKVPPGLVMESPARDGSDKRIPIHFSLVLDKKAAPQTYEAKIFVELGVSSDYGATFTSFLDSVELDINLQAATPIISLSSDKYSVSFPQLNAFQQRALVQDYIDISMDARGLYNYDAVALRILTDNGTESNGEVRMGMKGIDLPDWTVLLRAWTLNYGIGVDGNSDGVPDIENDTNWRGDDNTVWVYVTDFENPTPEDWSHITDPEDPFYDGQNAWGRPIFDYNELYRWSDYHYRQDEYDDYIYHIPQHLRLIDRTAFGGSDTRIRIYLAADFTDAFPQDYSTDLIVEAAFSDDGGYTIARKESLAVTISATVPSGSGQGIDWMKNRVDMRPDLDGETGSVIKLADSQQDENDFADSGFLYDQALLIMALTRDGDFNRAQQILNGMDYMQNDDGSFFFSYMTMWDDEKINAWATTDLDNNGKPDELENRINWATNNGLDPANQQLRSWAYNDYSSTVCPQTESILPDHILYRTNDFRKFTGSNAWLAMAITYYEKVSGDNQYRSMLDDLIDYLKSIQQLNYVTHEDSIDYGGVLLGRSFFSWAGEGFQGYDGPAIDNFVNLRSYSIEHNLDTYSAFRYYADLTGDQDAKERAVLIKDFILNNLWAPTVDLTKHPEATNYIENCFFVGLDLTDTALDENPNGLIDVQHYLDAQSWAVLTFGADQALVDVNNNAGTIDMALDFLDATDNRFWLDFNNNSIAPRPFLKVTGQSLYEGTSIEVSGIDGYKESARETYYQTASNLTGDFVWSEGSEGVVAARYLSGDTSIANYYHAETASYTSSNGAVPYSTLALLDSAAYVGKEIWSFANNPSVAGTAWYTFNEADANGLFNPFQPYTLPPDPVFTEDFESYTAGNWPETSEWTAYKSSIWFWQAVNTGGSMQMKGLYSSEQLLQINNQNLGDFTLISDIYFPSTSSFQAGVYFRSQDLNNYYIAYLEQGQSGSSLWAVVLGKIQNSSFTKLAGGGLGETIATGKSYRLKVEASGSLIKVYVDCGSGFNLILQATDATFTSGTLGLRGNKAGHASWDNVELYDVAGFNLGKSATKSLEETDDASVPKEFALLPNYPNPFNPQTTIRFELPQAENVKLEIFDASGRLVNTLVNDYMQAGSYQKRWNGDNRYGNRVSSGIYFIRIVAGTRSATQKAILLK